MHVRVSALGSSSSEAAAAAADAQRNLLSTQTTNVESCSRSALRDTTSPYKRRMLTRSTAGTFLQFSDGLAPLDPIVTVVGPAAEPPTDRLKPGGDEAAAPGTSLKDLDSVPTSPTSFGSAAPPAQQFQPTQLQQAAAQLLMVPGNDLAGPSDRDLGATSSLRVPSTSSASAGLSSLVPSTGPLSMSQRGELELARHRARKAAAGRKAKVPRPVKEQLLVDLDDEDSDLDLSKLGPEERESLISATLANLDDGKDAKRLKRLLRNRVSAQQARERKKQYVTTLEEQVRQHQAHIEELEDELKAAQAQNSALRKIIQSMQADKLQAGGSSSAD